MRRMTSCILLCCLFLALTPVFFGNLSADPPGDQQMGEIEITPGVWVRVDLWDDDYAPTYTEILALGFTDEDADAMIQNKCKWGEIKACSMGYYNDCCPKKGDDD